MNRTKLTFNQAQLCLPNINHIESSPQAFSNAFLEAAQTLHQQMEQIEIIIGEVEDFTKKPFNLTILSLFSKICRHYYSYVFLEIHHDFIGSQLLMEQLCEAAITLIYLLEEGDESLFSQYTSASVQQARSLLDKVTEQLQQFPCHSELLELKPQLEIFISRYNKHTAKYRQSPNSAVYLWGPQTADDTSKRAAVIGLDFMINPARKVALSVTSASWLELQLSSSHGLNPPKINFTSLRDAAYLCLHATRTLLEEVSDDQKAHSVGIESQQQLFNLLYEWFYNAHAAYERQCGASSYRN